MAQVYKEIRTRTNDDDVSTMRRDDYGPTVIARIVYIIGSVIVAVLAVRFILTLLGANRSNDFASFIYSVSYPFVAPFFGLFNYRERLGEVNFELSTLIAIAFWGFLTWLLVRLFTVGNRDNTTV